MESEAPVVMILVYPGRILPVLYDRSITDC
jgi:hypothetical protein